MAINQQEQIVTVGIVGGGVAGFALAKMLEMSGICYRLFEAHELLSPHGASIGLMPSGLRILDQLGVIDEIEKFSVAHDHWEHRDGKTGELLAQSAAFRSFPKLFGYGAYFMERQYIAKTVFESIVDKSRLQGFKKVVKIENERDYATIFASDGSSFRCRVVAGADGTHSIVRKFIRPEVPENLPPPDYLSANTYCIFGISTPLPQIGEGRHFSIYQHDASVLVFSGLDGNLYWFIFKQLDAPLQYGTRHAFNDDDVKIAYDAVANTVVTEGVQFSTVYEKSRYKITLPIEQGICESWHAKRMVLLGDSAHKMAPHAAMGANLAMESAACLVNELRKARTPSPETDNDQGELGSNGLSRCLQAYTDTRRDRVTAIAKQAALTEKIHLRVEPQSSKFIGALPKMTELDWLQPGLISIGQADKLDDWEGNSERVESYNQRAAEIRLAVQEGREKEYVAGVAAELDLV